MTGSPATNGVHVEAFKKTLDDLGYVEGRNLELEIRWAEGKRERYPALVDELLAWKPDVVVTTTSVATKALTARTATVPIVMASVTDPVKLGIVASLARPGANVTGLSNADLDESPKAIELLHAIVPRVTRMALVGAGAPSDLIYLTNVRDAAK
jgi:putative ABC transport system substrate-binding protein